MKTEVYGSYRIELSAMQLIHNGGWAGFAAVREIEHQNGSDPIIMEHQQVAEYCIFPTCNAALNAARQIAIEVASSAARIKELSDQRGLVV
jgi:hypothetical protein